ncbi:MAG: helix-turn-helix transcriptional regulator [Clostridia bacterium]|nr:helix-turn-helix transcriptional regulator [Clostridia bacterium]
MKILKRKHHNTCICFSESNNNSALLVSEVGYNTPPAGYRPKYILSDCYTLHYLVKGKIIHNGRILEAPSIFLLTPEAHTYEVAPSSNVENIEQYWILVNGTSAKTTFEKLGFTNDSLSAPCHYMDQAVAIFQELMKPSNYIDKNDGYYMLSGLFSIFALHSTQTNTSPNREISPLVDTIIDFIKKNYASIAREEDIANAVNISVSYMNKRFKAEMGITPMKHLTNHRIQRAKILLENTELSIAEISNSVGFSDPNYFCLVFKKHCNGLSPSAYRKNLRSSKNANK